MSCYGRNNQEKDVWGTKSPQGVYCRMSVLLFCWEMVSVAFPTPPIEWAIVLSLHLIDSPGYWQNLRRQGLFLHMFSASMLALESPPAPRKHNSIWNYAARESLNGGSPPEHHPPSHSHKAFPSAKKGCGKVHSFSCWIKFMTSFLQSFREA